MGDFCNCFVPDLHRPNPKYSILNHILTWLWCPSLSLSPVSQSLHIFMRERKIEGKGETENLRMNLTLVDVK